MKKWLLLSLVLIVVVVSILVIRGRLDTPKPVVYGSLLVRVPNSAYKYSLCSEAFSFAKAPADNPYKTDFTFHDPFRKAMVCHSLLSVFQNIEGTWPCSIIPALTSGYGQL